MRKKDDIELFHQYDVYVPHRLVKIFGDIEEEVASKVCANLIALDRMGDGDINILLSTSGGCHHSGMAIYDTIKACQNIVNIIGTGQVMSMGVYIMQAGDHRILTPHCEVMMHYGSMGYEANTKDVISMADFEKKIGKRMLDIIYQRVKVKKPRVKRADIDRKLLVDTFLTAEEAVAWGLADEVVGGE